MSEYYNSRDLLKEKTAFICKFLDVLASDIYPDDYDNEFNKNKRYIAINPEDAGRIVDNILQKKEAYIELYETKTPIEKKYIEYMFAFLERFNEVTSENNAYNVRGVYDCSSILVNNFKSYSITNRIIMVQIGIYSIDIIYEIITYENMNGNDRDYTKEIDCRAEIMQKLEKIIDYISILDTSDNHMNNIMRIHKEIICIGAGIKNGWLIDDLMALYFVQNYCYEFKACYDKYYGIKNKNISDLDIVEDLEIALKKIMQLEKNINERCIENISIRKELLMESREIMLGVNNVFYKLINILDKYSAKVDVYVELDEVGKVITRSIDKKIYPSELKMLEMIKNLDILTNSLSKSIYENSKAFDEFEVNLENDLGKLRRLLKYEGEYCSDSPSFEDFKDAYNDMLEYSEELFDDLEDVDFKRLTSCFKKLGNAAVNCKSEMERKGFVTGSRAEKSKYKAIIELIDVIEERKKVIQNIKITKFENELKIENIIISKFNSYDSMEDKLEFLLDMKEIYDKNLIVSAEKKVIDQLLMITFDERKILELSDAISNILIRGLEESLKNVKKCISDLRNDERYSDVSDDLIKEIAIIKTNLSVENRIDNLNAILYADKTNLNDNQITELKQCLKNSIKKYIDENNIDCYDVRVIDHKITKEEVEELNSKLPVNLMINREEEIFNANCVMIEKFSKSLKAWRKVGINPVRQVKALLGKDNSKIYDIMESLEDERQAERIMESMANNDPISRKDHDAVLIAIKEHKIKMGKKEWIVEK
jgi:hypothetical protein